MRLALFACLVFWLSVAAMCRGEQVAIEWNPNPEPDISHYRIWRGLEMLGETSETSITVDLPTDQHSHITVTAHTPLASSAHSEALVIMPVHPQSSEDLKTWKDEKRGVFFVQLTRDGKPIPKQFFRFRYNPTQ